MLFSLPLIKQLPCQCFRKHLAAFSCDTLSHITRCRIYHCKVNILICHGKVMYHFFVFKGFFINNVLPFRKF